MKITSTNPAKNYEIIGEIESSTKDEIITAVKQAKEIQPEWQAMNIAERTNLLKKVFTSLETQKEELAQLITQEMGMPIKEAREDVEFGLAYLNWYADHAEEALLPEVTFESDTELHTVHHEPYGVAAVIVPWNFPMSNFVWQCGQNLVAGNTVVFKHSEEVPLFAKKLQQAFEQSPLPRGVLNFVHGNAEIGDFLVHQDVDLICFTGSTKTGKYLYQVAAEKFVPARMELGGSAPGIIMEDANIDEILDTIMINRFMNCGQMCDGLKRLLVHQVRFDEVVEKIIQRAENLKIGDPLDETTELGPLVAERQIKILVDQVLDAQQKGGAILTGGKQPDDLLGAYYLPTVVTNISREMRIWQEEVFGPVLPIMTFKNTSEAVELANDTRYGLGGYVFTNDTELFNKIAAEVKTGMISQNNIGYVKECNPFGGYKESGLGREHGKYGFEDVTQVKVISQQKSY